MSDVVVSADWLADRLEDVRVVDVRDAWEYEGIGHIPGAVNIPFDAYRADEHAAAADSESAAAEEQSESTADDGPTADRQGMLPGSDTFASLMREAGIARTDDIVTYDDTHGVFAARLLVTAELYGHDRDRLHLLDGDFSAWRLAHQTSTTAPAVEPTTYEVVPPAETPLISMAEVAAASEAAETVLVDTREDWEYAEGHIPGAVRLDWRELVDEESRGLKPTAELEAILEDRGITPEKRIVLYCNTARRISHTYVVLRHLGYPDVAFYEGSLTEWEAAGRELATDSAPD